MLVVSRPETEICLVAVPFFLIISAWRGLIMLHLVGGSHVCSSRTDLNHEFTIYKIAKSKELMEY